MGLTDERLNQTLVTTLKKVVDACTNDWDEHISAALYAYQEFIMHAGRRVSNALYTLCKKSSESNVTSRLAHVTRTSNQTLCLSPDYEK